MGQNDRANFAMFFGLKTNPTAQLVGLQKILTSFRDVPTYLPKGEQLQNKILVISHLKKIHSRSNYKKLANSNFWACY
jgi:hypothetical protein